MHGQPLAELRRIGLQAGNAQVLFHFEIGLNGLLVCVAMTFEHDASGRFQLGRLMCEVGTGAALLLAGVGRQFHAVDGEHLASDQTLAVAQVEHLGKDAGNVVGET